MYAVEVFIEGRWILVDTKDLKLTDHLVKRARERGHAARRVMVVDGKRIPLDATA